ncbi:MAG: CoA transferase [Sphingopyxis sp.]|uniref:CaiB/BaiF CoA transferase family protein n=1 Tax=Sphingopyxis sp. TaxID=1908224 RepID=UPI002ABCC21D|nr:CoA transferase [Sphingopyxis sp.]MDZ3833530.1 CoA transferase [Sphingopyxis sp.]
MMNGTEGARPLAGVKVVELGVWIAAPAAGGIMADWGADVIKVEPPTGDPQRQAFRALGMDEGRMAPFELDNRGKRSVVLNLRDAADAERMFALLETADVFVTNVRTDALERLGLDAASVRSRFPRLIYGRVTGYGAQGPDRDRAGYDVGAFWARSGIAVEVAPRGAPPQSIPPALGDHITGVTMVSGIVAALYRRERTGVGGVVDASLLRTGLYALGTDITMQQNFGKSVVKRPREEAPTPLVNCYRAKDDRWLWMLGVEAARHWPKLVKAIDRPDLLDDPRFRTTRDQVANRKALIAEIDREIARHDRQYWQDRFDEFDLWWAPVQSLEDVLNDPQAIHSGAFVEIPGQPDFPPIPSVASPIDFDGAAMTPRGPSPKLGQHNEEVLSILPTIQQKEL